MQFTIPKLMKLIIPSRIMWKKFGSVTFRSVLKTMNSQHWSINNSEAKEYASNFGIVKCIWIRPTGDTAIKNASFTLPQGGVEMSFFAKTRVILQFAALVRQNY